jgi:gliding motility-associated-like protein
VGPYADAGPDTAICFGASATLVASGGGTYLWSTGDTTSTITVSPMVTTSYYLTVTATCTDYDTVTVFVNPLPIVTATASPPSIINGGSTTICGGGANTYTWTSAPPDPSLTGQTNADCPVVSPTNLTSYHVLGIDTNGCSNTAMVSVIVIPIYPVVDFWGDSLSGCQPLKVSFHDNSTKTVPGSKYYWEFGDGTHSSVKDPVAYYTEPGIYTVTLTVTNPGPLSSTLTVQDYVEVFANPDAAISTSPEHMTDILDPSFFFYDISTGNPTQWLWDFGDGTFDTQKNTYHTFSLDNYYLNYHLMEDTGFQTVKLTTMTAHGCSDTATTRVLIKPAYGIYIPNAFTPNNDGKNQDFCIKGYGLVRETYLLVIYDRWGNEVFSSTDIDECWDGNINGKKAEQGTFVYRVVFTDTMGTKRQKVGNITLIR